MKYRIVIIGVFIGLFSISCASNKNQKTPTVDLEGLEQARPIDAGSAEVRLQLAHGKLQIGEESYKQSQLQTWIGLFRPSATKIRLQLAHSHVQIGRCWFGAAPYSIQLLVNHASHC